MYLYVYYVEFSQKFRDSSFATDVLVHEYGHGLSNRLVGGPNNVLCLNSDQQVSNLFFDLELTFC